MEPVNLTGGPEIRLSQVRRTPGRPRPSLHMLGLSPAFWCHLERDQDGGEFEDIVPAGKTGYTESTAVLKYHP